MIWSENPPYLWWSLFLAGSCVLFFLSRFITESGDAMPLTRGNFGKEISLVQALGGYLRIPTASMLVLLCAGFWSWRIYLGGWSWRDLAVGGFVVAVWPFVEWIVHVYVLHAKPQTFFGFKYDPIFARIHRAHHRNPYHPTFGIVPPASLVEYGMIIPAFFFLFIVWPRPLTMAAVMTTMVLRYEMWHYLIHSAYKPKSEWFRKLRDRHWWHHFQHENYWYGITTVAADNVLGTNPLPHEVPKSPTARTLGHGDGAPRERSQEEAA